MSRGFRLSIESNVGIRVLAGGARVRAARAVGQRRSLTEAATRFAISHPAVGTMLVGLATLQQFEAALAAVEKGPLPPALLDRLTVLREGFVAGERTDGSAAAALTMRAPASA